MDSPGKAKNFFLLGDGRWEEVSRLGHRRNPFLPPSVQTVSRRDLFCVVQVGLMLLPLMNLVFKLDSLPK